MTAASNNNGKRVLPTVLKEARERIQVDDDELDEARRRRGLLGSALRKERVSSAATSDQLAPAARSSALSWACSAFRLLGLVATPGVTLMSCRSECHDHTYMWRRISSVLPGQ
jgi:hypothetical protein